MGIDYLDIAVRAGKTLAQTFVAAIVLPAANAFSLAAWKGAALAALAAAVSAAWNVVIAEIKLRRG